jgi:anti-sigma regulatory factor (Ser/Thr protein kinase)
VRKSRTFRCRPEEVTAARRFVTETLRDQDSEIVDAAELMTSELTTNCVCHAHTDFELVIDLHDEIRVEVRDSGSGQPRVLSPAPQDPVGRGLSIVQMLANDWGIITADGGKAVWFTLARAQRR